MNERRVHPRFPCQGVVEIYSLDRSSRSWGMLADLSTGGFYANLSHPWAADTPIQFVLQLRDVHVAGEGRIATSHPGVGMGVAISNLGPADRMVFRALLRELEVEAPQS